MQIDIVAVTGGGTLVEITSPVGRRWARWCGDAPTEVGATHDVELDVDEPRWGVDLVLGLPAEHDDASIPGVIEAVDADAVVLRVGGSLLLVAPEGDRPPGADVGATVTLTSPRLSLFPTNY